MDTGLEVETPAPKVFDSDTLASVKQHGPLERLTRQHQRSFHLTTEQASELVASPKEEVDYSLKGLPDRAPHVQWLGLKKDPSKFRIEGLVPRGETRRAKMKQEFLLSHGLPTEKFLEIYDLAEVPDKAEYMSVPATRGRNLGPHQHQDIQRKEKPPIPMSEWKRRVLEHLEFIRTHSGDEYFEKYRAGMLVLWKDMPPDDIEKVTDYIRRTDYVVVLREQPVEASFIDLQHTADQDSNFSASWSPGERITVYVNGEQVKFLSVSGFRHSISALVKKYKSDSFHDGVSEEEAKNAYLSMIPRLKKQRRSLRRDRFYHTKSTYFTERMLDRAFRYINNSEQFRDNPLLPRGGFSVANEEQIKLYFQQFVPVNMADYLAKLHSLGVSHGYAHGQNWKLGVFLMDLDSMKGAPLGDSEATDEAKKDDVQRSIEAIDALFSMQRLGTMGSGISHSYLASKFLTSGYDMRENSKLFAMRKEAVCQFLARYLQHQEQPVTRDGITEFISGFNIKEYTGSEFDFYSDPPITKQDYGDRIFEIASEATETE